MRARPRAEAGAGAVGAPLGPSGSLERVAVAELVHFNHLLCKFLCCKRSSEFKSILLLLLLLTLLLPFSCACVQLCVCVCVLCAFTLYVCVANIFKKRHTLQNCTMAPWLHGSVASQRLCVSLLRHAPPCSLTKSINTMQAQHDEHEADEGTRTHGCETPAQSQSQSRSRGRLRVRAGAIAVAFAGRVMYRHCRT